MNKLHDRFLKRHQSRSLVRNADVFVWVKFTCALPARNIGGHSLSVFVQWARLVGLTPEDQTYNTICNDIPLYSAHYRIDCIAMLEHTHTHTNVHTCGCDTDHAYYALLFICVVHSTSKMMLLRNGPKQWRAHCSGAGIESVLIGHTREYAVHLKPESCV